MLCAAMSKSTNQPCKNEAIHNIEIAGRSARLCKVHYKQHTNDGGIKLASGRSKTHRPAVEAPEQQRLNINQLPDINPARAAREMLARIPEEDTMSEPKEKFVIGFTGHRPGKLGGYDPCPIHKGVKIAMLAAVKRAIAKYGDTHEIVIVSGGALGVDTWAAKLAQHLGLRYSVFVPFQGQSNRWLPANKAEYQEICKGADEDLATELSLKLVAVSHTIVHEQRKGVLYISEPGYSAHKMNIRNEAMVDASDAMVAVWDGEDEGGTANCVRYIRKTKTPWVHINLNDIAKEVN